MKKKAIALVISIVLAASSFETAHVYATETTAEISAVLEEGEGIEKAVPEATEEADTGAAGMEETAQAEEIEYIDVDTEDSEEINGTSVNADDVEESTVIEEETETSAESNEAAFDASGTCGANATWKLTGTTLTISGKGKMNNFDTSESGRAPWSTFAGIRTIIIKDGITSIGSYAFYSNKQLNSISIASSVTSIGDSAFNKNEGLESITIPDCIKNIGDHAFSNSYLKSVTIGKGVSAMGSSAFANCRSLTDVTIRNGSKTIGDAAFYCCTNLTKISIPDSVTNIGGRAFYQCSSLKSINIPNSVTTIGDEAFWGCIGLTSVTIPYGVTEIGYGTFAECWNLNNLLIPNSMSYIHTMAFAGCGLSSITFPSSLKRFGYDETYPPFKFNKIIFNGSKEQWEAIGNVDRVDYRSITFMLVSNTFSEEAEFQLEKSVFNYTGNPVKPKVTVICNDTQLVEGKDYKLTYENNTNLGTAVVNVNGIGKYSGTAQLQFRIRIGNTPKITCTNVASGMKVSWVKVSGATRYKVYRDNKLIFTTSVLAVTDKDVKYNSGKKYTYKVVAVEKNTGDSELYKTGTYYRLMPVGIKSLSNPSPGKMTVTYDRSKGSSGYVVRYGLKSDMSDAKVITVKGEGILHRTFDGLKKGKTYYVQVRTYKLDNGVRYYSGYCTTKSITIKK